MTEKIQATQEKIRSALAPVELIRAEVGRIISGQEKLVERLLIALIADGHILLEGVPGLAKTLLVKTLSQTLNGSFSRIQFTPDLLPADVTGTRIYNAASADFSTRTGPVFANLVLADEINRAPAKVQSALLEAMQEHQVTIGGSRFDLPRPFMVLATENPIEQEGTYSLPEAQLDRFMFKLKADYPSREEERVVVERMAHPREPEKAVAVASVDDILKLRELLDEIYIDSKITEYILDIVIATRPGEGRKLSDRQSDVKLEGVKDMVSFGASPRASIAMVLAARALALISGRAYVLPQDVKNVAVDVLRHRIVLSYEAEVENITSDQIVNRILDQLHTP